MKDDLVLKKFKRADIGIVNVTGDNKIITYRHARGRMGSLGEIRARTSQRERPKSARPV